jgi:sec-independent protein translocase protein TatA
MGGLSWWHWLVIAAAFILLFGAKKLPDAARGVGRSLRILKSEVAAMNDDDKPAAPLDPTTHQPAIVPTTHNQIESNPDSIPQVARP